MSFGPESQLEKILADELDKEKISYTCQYRVYDRTNDLVPKYTLDFCIKAGGKLIGIEL